MADASCTLQTGGTVTTVPVGAKIKVRYEFNTTTKPNLALPYAVAIDGKILPEYAQKVRVLSSTRCIELTLAPGSQVSLFLNSDAHPRFRQHPVYPITVGNNDIVVRIREKLGINPQHQPEIGQPIATCDKDGKVTETYKTWLTGNIWMLISHRYTWEEAETLIPPDLPAPIITALQRIYNGLGGETMCIDFPANGDIAALLMTVKVGAQHNVNHNVSFCQLGSGVLPRTHPAAYAALLSAAYAVRLTKLRITSGWRPMLGSIAHRAGLGLDIDFIGSTAQAVKLNRESLKDSNAMGNGENVSASERDRYRDYQLAKANHEEAEKAEREARQAFAHNQDPSQSAALKSLADAAKHMAKTASEGKQEAQKKWVSELNSNEPLLIRNLRQMLSSRPTVGQLLDPWYMDTNTRDMVAAASNEQISDNELTHNNHLHITIVDPILP